MENQNFLNFINWCESNDNIRTVILTSSRANPNSKHDILSDYDIELYVQNLVFFQENDDWIERFGSILVKWPLFPGTTWSTEWITRLIQFKDGTRFDFQITDKAPKYHPNFDAGYKVFLDKDNVTESIPPANFSNLFIKRPTEKEFLERINAFFWNIIYVAKNLRRDELFYAKFMLDNEIRFGSFQVFIEWYIGIQYNWSISTNKYGRFFKKYLDPDIWEQIKMTFSSAELKDNWEAMYKMIEISGYLNRESALKLNYQYPSELEKNVLEYIKNIQNLKALNTQLE